MALTSYRQWTGTTLVFSLTAVAVGLFFSFAASSVDAADATEAVRGTKTMPAFTKAQVEFDWLRQDELRASGPGNFIQPPYNTAEVIKQGYEAFARADRAKLNEEQQKQYDVLLAEFKAHDKWFQSQSPDRQQNHGYVYQRCRNLVWDIQHFLRNTQTPKPPSRDAHAEKHHANVFVATQAGWGHRRADWPGSRRIRRRLARNRGNQRRRRCQNLRWLCPGHVLRRSLPRWPSPPRKSVRATRGG